MFNTDKRSGIEVLAAMRQNNERLDAKNQTKNAEAVVCCPDCGGKTIVVRDGDGPCSRPVDRWCGVCQKPWPLKLRAAPVVKAVAVVKEDCQLTLF